MEREPATTQLFEPWPFGVIGADFRISSARARLTSSPPSLPGMTTAGSVSISGNSSCIASTPSLFPISNRSSSASQFPDRIQPMKTWPAVA